MAEEDKKIEDSPQMVELQNQMAEMKTQLEQATGVIENQTAEIDKFRDTAKTDAADKRAQERDLKSALGVAQAPKKRTAEDVNSLNNVEMLDIITSAVDGAITAEREDAGVAMDNTIKTLDSKFDQVVGYLQKKSVAEERSVMQNAHKDFDTLTPDISKIIDKHPTMTYNEAYTLAKANKLNDQLSNKHTETEKGDAPSTAQEGVERKKVADEGKVKTLGGRRGFQSRLRDAVDKVIDARQS